MASYLKIRTINRADVPLMTSWARQEGFAPGKGDVGIYRHTDRQGLWVGCLGGEPIGCIAGVRYNLVYGFIGLYIVRPDHRGQGYGKELWQHALMITPVGVFSPLLQPFVGAPPRRQPWGAAQTYRCLMAYDC